MFNRLLTSFFILNLVSFNVSAMKGENPFAKNESLNIGKEISWKIDKETVVATKTAQDEKGNYYHLQFDNEQIKLIISSDANADNPKAFSQLEVKNVTIDGKQSPLFKWCLANQQRHSRFLQQGLVVKKDICMIDGEAGGFVMHLNKDTLLSLQEANRLSIMLKPFRTPLDLNYDISDFKDMVIVLNAKPEPVVTAAPIVTEAKLVEKAVVAPAAKIIIKKCWASPPEKYENIPPVEYDCDDAAAKNNAEVWITKLVNEEKAKAQKLVAERELRDKLAEEKKQKAQAEKLKQEKMLQAEAAAIAASQAKQAKISNEITMKMLNVCKKYWDKGEHRCYCQKYIEYAPSSIQASSSCE